MLAICPSLGFECRLAYSNPWASQPPSMLYAAYCPLDVACDEDRKHRSLHRRDGRAEPTEKILAGEGLRQEADPKDTLHIERVDAQTQEGVEPACDLVGGGVRKETHDPSPCVFDGSLSGRHSHFKSRLQQRRPQTTCNRIVELGSDLATRHTGTQLSKSSGPASSFERRARAWKRKMMLITGLATWHTGTQLSKVPGPTATFKRWGHAWRSAYYLDR